MKISIVIFGLFGILNASNANFHDKNSCSPRQPPEHGYVEPDERFYSAGDEITFGCNVGYIINGSQKDLCLKSGTWKIYKTPYCEAMCFARSPPEHGQVTPSKEVYTIGYGIEFDCNHGFELDGSRMDECVGPNMWLVNDTPRCLPVPRCRSRYSFGTVHVIPKKEYFFPGDNIRFTCDNGFHLEGSEYDYCQENGTWRINTETYCSNTCAPLRHIVNGVITPLKKYYLVGNQVIFTCRPFHQLVGRVVNTCEKGGWLNIYPSKCIRACAPQPAPENGFVKPVQQYYEVGSSITYSCKDGYTLIGEENDYCSHTGDWLYKKPSECVRRVGILYLCGPRKPPDNGRVEPDKLYYYPGNNINFMCDQGYYLDEASFDVCLSDGTWKANLRLDCKPNCPRTGGPKNGGVWPPPYRQFLGGVVTFRCDTGFDLVGNDYDKCVGLNEWLIDDMPKCLPERRCHSRYFPKNGSLFPNKLYYIPGDQIRFECDPQYYLEGVREDYCQYMGTWKINKETHCKPFCSPLKPIMNGKILPTRTLYQVGDVALFTCLPGFRLIKGSNKTKCDVTGWSRYVVPVCSRACPPRPAPLHGYVKPVRTYYKPGSRIKFSCKDDYELIGKDKDHCNASGIWYFKRTPKCIRKSIQ